jgi:hypothetical protein
MLRAMGRVAFWMAVLSPLLVVGLGLLAGAVLDLMGADCVTYGNNPMHLDNDTVCNDLGDLQSGLGWTALLLAMVLVPVALATGAVGAWRSVMRRSK